MTVIFRSLAPTTQPEAEAAASSDSVGVWHDVVKVYIEPIVDWEGDDESCPGDGLVHLIERDGI